VESSWRSIVWICREHLVRHLELLAVGRMNVILPWLSIVLILLQICSPFPLIYLALLILLLPIIISPCLNYLFPPRFFMFVISFSWFLSPSFSHHLLLSLSFLWVFFLHYNISLFHTTLAKPCSQTFRDFLGDCKQVSPTLCRHELVLMLQLWKSLQPSHTRPSTRLR